MTCRFWCRDEETLRDSQGAAWQSPGGRIVFRPLPMTAADTLAWFRSQSEERQAKLLAGVAPEREAALLAKWNDGSHLEG